MGIPCSHLEKINHLLFALMIRALNFRHLLFSVVLADCRSNGIYIVEFVYFSSQLQGKEYFLGHPVCRDINTTILNSCGSLRRVALASPRQPVSQRIQFTISVPRRTYVLSALGIRAYWNSLLAFIEVLQTPRNFNSRPASTSVFVCPFNL